MLENFVTYEQALALKELGFDIPVNASWIINKMYPRGIIGFGSWQNSNSSDNHLSAPLYQQCFRWFREKYKLFPNFHKNELTDKYRYDEIKNTETYEVLYDSMDYYFNVEFETYEEAESACIDKLIEIVKKK
jgi:hypothetical protein